MSDGTEVQVPSEAPPALQETTQKRVDNNMRFLRICLPGDASSIAKVDFDQTLWDIMAKVGPKRGCAPENHHVVVHTLDGTTCIGENDKTLSSFGGIDYLEIQQNSDYRPPVPVKPLAKERLANYVALSSSEDAKAAGGITNSKHTNIRMTNDFNFPETVTDSNILSQRMHSENSGGIFQGVSNYTSTLKKNGKPMMKNLSMMLFKKNNDDPEGRKSSDYFFHSSVTSLVDGSTSPSLARNERSLGKQIEPSLGNSNESGLSEASLSPVTGDEVTQETPVTAVPRRESDSETLKSPVATGAFNLGSFAFESTLDDWTHNNNGAITPPSVGTIPENCDLITPATSQDIPESAQSTVSRKSTEPPRPINTSVKAAPSKDAAKSSSQTAIASVSIASIETGSTSRPTSFAQRKLNESSTDESRSPSTSSILNDPAQFTLKPISGEKIRKRTASTPISAHGTMKRIGLGLESPSGECFQYSTLKRPNLKGNSRARASTDSKLSGAMDIFTPPDANSDVVSTPLPEDEEKIILRVLLPEQQSTRMYFVKSQSMERVLALICQKRNLEYESFTLEVSIPGVNLEMDRPLSYYVDEMKVTEITVVQKEKTYSTMCVSEDGQDVLVLQIINGKLQVMAGTIEKLIERLTDAELPDEEYLDTLLLTFRSFISPTEFFDLLVSRFNCELPDDPSAEDIQYFAEMQIPTQKRVLLIFKWWVKNHYNDFAISPALKADLEDFTSQLLEYNGKQFRVQAFELKESIEEESEKFDAMTHTYKSAERRGKTIDGMVGEISTEDLAEQLCLHNFTLFKNIHALEYLNQIWSKENNATPCMQLFIERSDKESYWVATEIVKEIDLKKRAKLLSKFIATAQLCREHQNFFSMFSIIAGLNMPPIQRLKKTWEVLPEKTKKIWAELERMVDPSRNMKNFRDVLATADGAIVPFLPIYLKDLIFMNDGNESTVGPNKLINFDKLRMMGNRVMDITRIGDASYRFTPNPTIQNFIAKPPIEKSMTKLKQMSIECEK